MQLNSDFSQKVLIHDRDNPWQTSPAIGVERKMLDRIGNEIARATTIVRFAPQSSFEPHTHYGGEEYIVLDGVFQDESGNFPAGSYVRNPPMSRHTPSSELGATIFVKLWQFDPKDRTHLIININSIDLISDALRYGIKSSTLFKDTREHVSVEKWLPNTSHNLDFQSGAEILVLNGSLTENGQRLCERDWIRFPVKTQTQLTSGPNGARI